jgi:hypothetical protein
MKTKRKAAPRPMVAQVISLEAYRRARGVPVPVPAPLEHDSVVSAYCRWLALAGAVWTFWW